MIDCPKCRSGSHVTNSRQTHGTVRRRRECERCGHRWTTREISDEEWLALTEGTRAEARSKASRKAQATRRGFSIPDGLREEYFSILGKGYRPKEAAKILGIIT